MQKIFITGTDTDIGKTTFACQYLRQLNKQGFKTTALKPIAAGCDYVNGKWLNDDALKLSAACNTQMDYSTVNPIALPKPIAPHLQHSISAQSLKEACTPAFEVKADVLIIEGAGGWLCPINKTETLADFVKLVDAEVILVVGIKLGCLNHAQLTERAIQNAGVKYTGWIANCIDPSMGAQDENIEALKILLQGDFLTTLVSPLENDLSVPLIFKSKCPA